MILDAISNGPDPDALNDVPSMKLKAENKRERRILSALARVFIGSGTLKIERDGKTVLRFSYEKERAS